MDTRLENIEIQMAYMEKTVEQLNQVVIKQQDQIDLLIQAIKQLKQQQQGNALVRPLSEEIPPPHY